MSLSGTKLPSQVFSAAMAEICIDEALFRKISDEGESIHSQIAKYDLY